MTKTKVVAAVLLERDMITQRTTKQITFQASEPVLMCSLPGYDASNRVDDLATHLNKQITSIAIGSSEGFEQV